MLITAYGNDCESCCREWMILGWLCRAVDPDGYVPDEIVQVRRNTKAAKRLLVRLLKKQGLAPKHIITDKLRSFTAPPGVRSCPPSSIALIKA